jgi:hypothetical protein
MRHNNNYSVKLAEESGASKEALTKILNAKTKGVGFDTRKQLRYEDLLKGKIDVDFVARLEKTYFSLQSEMLLNIRK